MKYAEAVEAMVKGEKVCLPDWGENYWKVEEGHVIGMVRDLNDGGQWSQYPPATNDPKLILSDNWQIYREKVGIEDVIKALKEGKVVEDGDDQWRVMDRKLVWRKISKSEKYVESTLPFGMRRLTEKVFTVSEAEKEQNPKNKVHNVFFVGTLPRKVVKWGECEIEYVEHSGVKYYFSVHVSIAIGATKSCLYATVGDGNIPAEKCIKVKRDCDTCLFISVEGLSSKKMNRNRNNGYMENLHKCVAFLKEFENAQPQ